MALTKRYYWKELSSKGKLKEPREFSLNGYPATLNDWEGFASAEDAEDRLATLSNELNIDPYFGDLVLVPVYKLSIVWELFEPEEEEKVRVARLNWRLNWRAKY